MELREYVRKPFPVKAVEVDFKNADDVAKWCGGRVELVETRLLGGAGKGKMDLPTVVFKGTGNDRDKEFTAGLGDWIVELRGSFRVFKKAQFRATFVLAEKPEGKNGHSIKTTVDGEKTEVCVEHGTTAKDCVKQHTAEDEALDSAFETEQAKIDTEYCIDHNQPLSACGELHMEDSPNAERLDVPLT